MQANERCICEMHWIKKPLLWVKKPMLVLLIWTNLGACALNANVPNDGRGVFGGPGLEIDNDEVLSSNTDFEERCAKALAEISEQHHYIMFDPVVTFKEDFGYILRADFDLADSNNYPRVNRVVCWVDSVRDKLGLSIALGQSIAPLPAPH